MIRHRVRNGQVLSAVPFPGRPWLSSREARLLPVTRGRPRARPLPAPSSHRDRRLQGCCVRWSESGCEGGSAPREPGERLRRPLSVHRRAQGVSNPHGGVPSLEHRPALMWRPQGRPRPPERWRVRGSREHSASRSVVLRERSASCSSQRSSFAARRTRHRDGRVRGRVRGRLRRRERMRLRGRSREWRKLSPTCPTEGNSGDRTTEHRTLRRS